MAGAFSAMFTPFTPNNTVNEEAIFHLIEYGIREGLKGFYLTGSTGEGLLLSLAERALVYRTAVQAARGRCKLIAQVGAVSTEDSVALAKAAADAGCDWISSVAPVYFGQSFEAQVRHYKMRLLQNPSRSPPTAAIARGFGRRKCLFDGRSMQ